MKDKNVNVAVESLVERFETVIHENFATKHITSKLIQYYSANIFECAKNTKGPE